MVPHRGTEVFCVYQGNIDQFVDGRGNIETYDPEEFNLDQINMGKVLFLLYRETGDERYKKALCNAAGTVAAASAHE